MSSEAVGETAASGRYVYPVVGCGARSAMEVLRTDIAIIGSGPGGGTLFNAVAASGADVLLVERGAPIPREPENWDVRAVFDTARYRAHDYWLDADGRRFRPGVHYNV